MFLLTSLLLLIHHLLCSVSGSWAHSRHLMCSLALYLSDWAHAIRHRQKVGVCRRWEGVLLSQSLCSWLYQISLGLCNTISSGSSGQKRHPNVMRFAVSSTADLNISGRVVPSGSGSVSCCTLSGYTFLSSNFFQWEKNGICSRNWNILQGAPMQRRM